MKWAAVLFDLDGTLIHTSPEIADAVNDTLDFVGRPPVTQHEVDGWIGQGTRELLILALMHAWGRTRQQVLDHTSFPQTLAAFDGFYLQRCGTRSQLYPFVHETLARLRRQGVRLGVLTNKETRYTEAVLKAHGLAPSFDAVVCGDTLPTRKPDPAGAHSMLDRWGIDARRALMVGDSCTDVATARQAGMAVCLLPYGYNHGQPVSACLPDRVIADLSQLV